MNDSFSNAEALSYKIYCSICDSLLLVDTAVH